jgi:4-hydroxybenzoate polyprenyltransferase
MRTTTEARVDYEPVMTHDRVLCVDLDGTLIATDMLGETLLSAIRVQPAVLFKAPLWLLRGRAFLKRQLAQIAVIDFATLPYRAEVIALVESERRNGRRVVLATASDLAIAQGVANHLGCFSEVLASDGDTNLKAGAKASRLIDRFGARNFDYLGDSHADTECWESAVDAMTVGVMPARVAHLRRLERSVGDKPASKLKAITKALRVHQWLKNLLLLVPVFAAHRVDWPTAWHLAIAFVSLSFCASGGYVLNDLLDLRADRRHSRKRHRPFASGRLSLGFGAVLIAASWIGGFGLAALFLPPAFVLLAAVYLVSTIAYSVRLKKEPVLDVMFLAGLYVVRVVGGGVATGVVVSTWLLAFTLFVCLSLAFMKRFIEVRAQSTSAAPVPGRGYLPDDAHWLQSAGLASAYLSVVILAIYVNNPDVSRLYSSPDRLLLMCPVLLYWATRTWHGAHRQLIHDDPLVAVASDPATYVLIALCAVIVLIAV